MGSADGGVLLLVCDPGIGLPAGADETLFQSFGQAANAVASNLPGLGLGLHFSGGIVERHDGRMWAESAGEGRGTTVRVRLPARPPAGEGAPSQRRGDSRRFADLAARRPSTMSAVERCRVAAGVGGTLALEAAREKAERRNGCGRWEVGGSPGRS